MRKKTIILLFFLFLVQTTLVSSVSADGKKYNMSYLYNGTPDDYINYVDNTNGSVETVTPNFFDINTDGSLKITNKYSADFVAEMKKRNVKITPFISNHWDREIGRKALANRESLANEIVSFIKEKDLDGINVDLEGLTEADRNSFTDFIKLLRAKLPSDKIVSAAVAANPNGYTKGWHGMYDYEELAKHVDYLMIMAYDESWEGSEPGPVASSKFVEDSILYALNHHVSPSKIVLGLPLYGRMWRMEDLQSERTSEINGDGVSLYKIDPIFNLVNETIQYDETAGSVKATFEIKDGQSMKLYSWSTDVLPPGHYVLWYDNDRSLKHKISFVHKYNLKGISSWSLGQEDPAIWDQIDVWLRGLNFKDVPFTYWAQENIAYIYEKEWMTGRSTSVFAPNEGLKRSEAAAILVRVLGLSAKEPLTGQFSDVKDNHWAQSAIEIAYQNGVMMGRTEESFAPDQHVTREEMAVILSRVLSDENIPATYSVTFPDVNENRWSYSQVMEMAAKGIFGGMPDGSFLPKDAITRAQMAALLSRISGYVE